MKILSPAGNFESLKMAIFNGADEVYLGINDFNARNNIDGFTLDNLESAVDFAHVYGVKVSLAINILFSDDELQNAVNTLINAYNMGVDYFIIQDLALADFIHKNYPNVKLHASTQMGIHNLEGVKYIEKFGFSRVVLARETSLEEIKRIKDNSDIEIEYFIHGALCVSFSGNCYLSSYLHNASGNRGKCKQLCRLPYALKVNNKLVKKGYLLSAKDFNMINRLRELEKAGVNVLKIEGRARRPYYVAVATKSYRLALSVKTADVNSLKLAFNRTFTEGYFNKNNNIISDIQNHVGIKVGNVFDVKKGKNFNQVFIKTNYEISPKSTLKFFYNNLEKNTLSAFDVKKVNNELFVITTIQKIDIGLDVHIISDAKLEFDELKSIKKVELPITLNLSQNSPISATLNLANKKVSIIGERLEKAINQPLSKQDVFNSFFKNEFFNPNITFGNFDQVFISKQKLNEFRRKVYQTAIENLTLPYKKQEPIKKIDTNLSVNNFTDYQVVEDVESEFTAKNIIYSPEIYTLNKINEFIDKCKISGCKPYLDSVNFATKEDIVFFKSIIDKSKITIVANNYYVLSLTDDFIVGSGLNVYNSRTANIFNKPILSAENTKFSYFKAPYMILRHCPIKTHLGGSCENCKFTNNVTYVLDDKKELKLKRKKLKTCTFYLT